MSQLFSVVFVVCATAVCIFLQLNCRSWTSVSRACTFVTWLPIYFLPSGHDVPQCRNASTQYHSCLNGQFVFTEKLHISVTIQKLLLWNESAGNNNIEGLLQKQSTKTLMK